MKLKIISVISIVCVLIGSAVCYRLVERSKFTIERWSKDIYEREYMLNDLMKKYDIGEMSYDEIILLLGTNGVVPNSKIQYYIGKSYIGPILFSITFDEDDTVKSFGKIVD